MFLFGGHPLLQAIKCYIAHYHPEGNHKGCENRLLRSDPRVGTAHTHSPVVRHERLGGLLSYYHHEEV